MKAFSSRFAYDHHWIIHTYYWPNIETYYKQKPKHMNPTVHPFYSFSFSTSTRNDVHKQIDRLFMMKLDKRVPALCVDLHFVYQNLIYRNCDVIISKVYRIYIHLISYTFNNHLVVCFVSFHFFPFFLFFKSWISCLFM